MTAWQRPDLAEMAGPGDQGAAAGAIGWMRRLSAHPVIGGALAAGELSESWARQICEWTDRLPQAQRGDADEILAGAARGGAELSGLAGLAQEMYERSHPDGPDDLFESDTCGWGSPSGARAAPRGT